MSHESVGKTDRTVEPAMRQPCAHCPWRIALQGTPNPHGFYSKRNLARLWAGLRRGERMTCHPTDHNMNEFEHAPRVKDTAVTHECAGSLILTQREFMKASAVLQAEGGTVREYRRRWPRGLTKDGLGVILNRAVFGGTMVGGKAMTKPNLNDPEVGYEDAVGPWPPEGLKLP